MAGQTGLSLVTDALLLAGVVGQGQQPNAFDTQLMLRLLNDLSASWTTRRWLIWRLVELGVTSDGRTTPYLIGPGAVDYPVTRRPDRIEFAYLRQLVSGGLPVDTPLTVWEAREQYDLATLKKSFVSYPRGLFLDTAYPTGGISLYPWPTSALYQVFIAVKDVLPIFTLATSLDSIPGQYTAAFKYELAKRARQAYGKGLKPDPMLNIMAKDALNAVKDANLQVPELQMPAGIVGRGNYNIYSDGQ